MKRRLAFVAVSALAGIGAPLPAATPEAQVKAAYLFKLAAFVRWPGPAPDAFRICVAGRADIAGSLTALTKGQRVDGKNIAIIQLAPAQAQDASGCQVLFVGRGAETARTMLKASAGNPVLTVTDRNGGTRGGVIEFMVAGGKVRLSIDRSEASAHKLELSSKLMDVAAEVRP